MKPLIKGTAKEDNLSIKDNLKVLFYIQSIYKITSESGQTPYKEVPFYTHSIQITSERAKEDNLPTKDNINPIYTHSIQNNLQPLYKGQEAGSQACMSTIRWFHCSLKFLHYNLIVHALSLTLIVQMYSDYGSHTPSVKLIKLPSKKPGVPGEGEGERENEGGRREGERGIERELWREGTG